MKTLGVPHVGAVYVNKDSSTEAHLKDTLAVVGEGPDEQGDYRLEICSDRSIRLCSTCETSCANAAVDSLGVERELG